MEPAQTEDAMAKQAERPHPCERVKALDPWRPDHLYINDSGFVLCGRCMGVESTYSPWAWSDLGKIDADRKIEFTREQIGQSIEGLPGAEDLVMRCETDRNHRSKH
jgi:hypothetical protein